MADHDQDDEKDVHAVDFDATLSFFDHWVGAETLGKPIPEMVAKVKAWRAKGEEVFIFTARVNPGDDTYEEGLSATLSYIRIAQWCKQHLGEILPITHEKSKRWTQIHDDRADQILKNTGVSVTDLMGAMHGEYKENKI